LVGQRVDAFAGRGVRAWSITGSGSMDARDHRYIGPGGGVSG